MTAEKDAPLTQSERRTYQSLRARGYSREDALGDALDGVDVHDARGPRFYQAVDTIALHLNLEPRIAPAGEGPALIHLPNGHDIDRVADHFGVGSTIYGNRTTTRVTLAGTEVVFIADRP